MSSSGREFVRVIEGPARGICGKLSKYLKTNTRKNVPLQSRAFGGRASLIQEKRVRTNKKENLWPLYG